MKAAVMKKKGLVEVEEIEIPVPNEDQVRIAVQLAGICGSDNSIFHGKIDAPFPLIPGHEAVGVIDTIGTAVTRFKPGQRVTIHPNYACGHCSTCVKGMPNICRNKIRLGVDINGVFADYVVVPQKAVLPVPDSLPNEIAALAEPLAVTVHATHQVDITPDSRVLIFGAGVMGQLTLQLALQHTKDVTACDLMEPRLALATQMGARNVIGAKDDIAAFKDSFDIIFETSGAPPALSRAIELAAPGGTIVVLGIPGEMHPVSTVMIVRKELKIIGSMIYTNEIEESLSLLAEGVIQTGPLVSDIIGLHDLQHNLEHFNAPQRIKTLVRL